MSTQEKTSAKPFTGDGIDTLATIGEIAEHFEVSKQTISRWVKQGNMPAPIRFGRRAIRWHVGTLNAWIERQNQQAAKQEEARA